MEINKNNDDGDEMEDVDKMDSGNDADRKKRGSRVQSCR
jgi:hypothetical protein